MWQKGECLIQNKVQIGIVKELKDLFISFIRTNETMHVSPSNCLKHNIFYPLEWLGSAFLEIIHNGYSFVDFVPFSSKAIYGVEEKYKFGLF